MSGLGFLAIAAKVRSAFHDVGAEQSENGQPFLRVPGPLLGDVARRLRDDPELRFDALMDLTAWDRLRYPATPASDTIAVVLLLGSYALRHRVMLEVDVARDGEVPSVAGVWPAAIYFEREVFDLFGVRFAGHPGLGRILCPEDWSGHPLRKDYLYPADYHGVPHLRDGQHFEQGPRRVGDPEPAPAPAGKAAHP